MFNALSESQQKKLLTWFRTHEYTYTGAAGGRYTYEITPLSIGEIIKVRDNISNDVIDITEYEDW